MHKLGYMTAVGALLLALTACSSSAGEPEANAGTAQATPITSAETAETAAPLVAETPATIQEETTPESEYLREVHAQMEQPISQLPKDATDEQLLAAADKACELMRAGTLFSDITVLDGETRLADTGEFRDSGVIADAASRLLCTDVKPNYGYVPGS